MAEAERAACLSSGGYARLSRTFLLYLALALTALLRLSRTWNLCVKLLGSCAGVVAQLVEWWLLTPEICGLNPVINKILSIKFSTNKHIVKWKRR